MSRVQHGGMVKVAFRECFSSSFCHAGGTFCKAPFHDDGD